MRSRFTSHGSHAEPDGRKGKEEKPEPEANFALSGKLAAETNTVKGVVLVHQEPPEARKPAQMWRLYGFKNGDLLSSSVHCMSYHAHATQQDHVMSNVTLERSRKL